MDLDLFKSTMQQRNYKLSINNENVAFGVESGYPVRATLITKGVHIIRVEIDMKTYLLGNNMSTINLNRNHNYTVKTSKKVLLVNINVAGGANDFIASITNLIDLLKKCAVQPADICPVCNQGNCDIFADFKPAYSPTHQNCLAQNQVQMAKQKPALHTYFTGLIGAFLGAIIGSLPSFLVTCSSQKPDFLLLLFIPICIALGYHIFKGKPSVFSIIITIILTISFVFITSIASLSILLFTADSQSLQLADIQRLWDIIFRQGAYWFMIIQASFFAFVSLGIVVFSYCKKILRMPNPKYFNSDYVDSTVITKRSYQKTDKVYDIPYADNANNANIPNNANNVQSNNDTSNLNLKTAFSNFNIDSFSTDNTNKKDYNNYNADTYKADNADNAINKKDYNSYRADNCNTFNETPDL